MLILMSPFKKLRTLGRIICGRYLAELINPALIVCAMAIFLAGEFYSLGLVPEAALVVSFCGEDFITRVRVNTLKAQPGGCSQRSPTQQPQALHTITFMTQCCSSKGHQGCNLLCSFF